MNTIILSVFVLSAFLVSPSIANAQARGPAETDSSVGMQQRRMRLEQDESLRPVINPSRYQEQMERDTRMKQRCTNVNRNLTAYQNRHELSSRSHVMAFRRVEENLTRLVARLESSAAVDATTITRLLTELTAKIDQFESNNVDYITSLQEIPESACSKGDQNLRVVLQSTQTAFRQLKNEAAEIRSFIQNAIRPELLQLREQAAQSDSE